MNIRFLIPFFLLPLFMACTQTAPQEPLIERNEEVRDYFTVLNELIDEYGVLVEEMVASTEQVNDDGEVSFLEGLNMIADLAGPAMKIKELTEEINGMEEQQKQFEENLSADDFIEFTELYKKTILRFTELVDKLEKSEEAS